MLADRGIPDEVEGAGIALSAALADHHGRRLRPGELAGPLGLARSRLERLGEALRAIETTDGDAQTRKARAQKVLGALVDDLDAALGVAGDADVAWVEGPPGNPILRLAPVDVAVTLGPLWDATTAVLTSATVPPGLSGTLGLPTDRTDELDVGSPFDYAANTVLYCAAHLPDPRADGYAAAVADELAALIEAAGGRTLALFTSWRAMQAALDAVRPRVSTPILAQGELPKPALVDAFAADEATSLFATMGFWQGIDLPGRTLSLVTIDRLPFPRPDDPLLQARRDRIGRGRAFGAVDLPRAATLLAQGRGPADPHGAGPWRRRRVRSPPRHRRLPLGHRAGAATHAEDPPPSRSRSLPPRHHGRRPTIGAAAGVWGGAPGIRRRRLRLRGRLSAGRRLAPLSSPPNFGSAATNQ